MILRNSFLSQIQDICCIVWCSHSKTVFFRYFVSGKHLPKLEQLIQQMAKETGCPKYIRHKGMMIPPSLLKKHGIDFARVWIHISLQILLDLMRPHIIVLHSGQTRTWSICYIIFGSLPRRSQYRF